ncbi:hypothetical protein D3C87_1036110 [compost metagenome]
MARNCGSCKYFKPGEFVSALWPNGRMELEEYDGRWGVDRGACIADPKIRPMPRAWFYSHAGFLTTLGTTKRSGISCLRWDDGGRDLTTVELEMQAAMALERAADEARVTSSTLLMQMLETHRRKLAAARRKHNRTDRNH